jgi:OOP family OmpA-OmpF porin
MNKPLKLSALLAAMVLSASAFAAKSGYLADQSTTNVTRNNYNECWHTNYFDKAAEGLVECGDKEAPKAVVAPAPAPAPKTVTYTKEKVTLSTEVLFEFNKAVLRPQAASELDPLAGRLKADENLKSVDVQGFTDYLGSDKYNQALSQKRADAVRQYFVNAGVAADKVTAEGKGKSEPKVADECRAKFKKEAKKRKASAGLKACLAPDRRVEVSIETAKVTPAQ